jgi:hypothetical protein
MLKVSLDVYIVGVDPRDVDVVHIVNTTKQMHISQKWLLFSKGILINEANS